MYLTEPADILYHFLRANVSEITRNGVSNRHATRTQSFNGTGAVTSFVLTDASVVCINSVTVGGTRQTPYLHYDIDLDNHKINFSSSYIPGIGTNNIVVSYEYGNNWIYPDKPRVDMKQTEYPRIGIMELGENGQDIGLGETDTYENLTFQIDVMSYKDQMCTISNEQKADVDVTQYLARQVIKKILENRSDIQTKLKNPSILNNIPTPFEENKNVVRRIIEVKFESINSGR